MVTRTIRAEPYKAPRSFLAKVRENLLSADSWSDIPWEVWVVEELKKAKKAGVPVIASVGGKPDEVARLASEVAGAGADGIEISARHSGGDPSQVAEAVRAAKSAASVPVFVKVGTPSPLDVALAAEKAGADGLVCMDAIRPALGVDVEVALPLLGTPEGEGMLSGPAIKPLALYWTARIARATSIPIIGCGGISSGSDAVEFIQAGASAVQVCTAAVTRGPKVFGIIADEILRFLRSRSCQSIEDIKGKLLSRLPEQSLRAEPKPPEIVHSRCSSCGICVQQCPASAMWLSGRGIRIDPGRCDGCGLCVTVCPTRALRW